MGHWLHGMARRAEQIELNPQLLRRSACTSPRAARVHGAKTELTLAGGTEGSNPSPSTGESVANLTSLDQAPKGNAMSRPPRRRIKREGPRVRIHFPPALSPLRTSFSGGKRGKVRRERNGHGRAPKSILAISDLTLGGSTDRADVPIGNAQQSLLQQRDRWFESGSLQRRVHAN